jgi:hypothetical protein
MNKAKWLPTLLPVLAALGVALEPSAQALIAAHPLASTVAAALYALLAHICPHPLTNGSR